MNDIIIKKIIENALLEDINGIDIANDYISELKIDGKGTLLVKEDGVISGLDVFESVFKFMDTDIEVKKFIKDGDSVKAGDVIAEVRGNAGKLLQAERTALNILQRMSGISTEASIYANIVEGLKTKVTDTRKTTPGLRILEKYAVRVGGCFNHRYNLCDLIMLKDNHIKALGGITKAVESIREKSGHSQRIEVEVENIEQFREALETDADIIMLDNMNTVDMKYCVELNLKASTNYGRKIIEASGNITKENLRKVAETGIDIVSIGALTHSVKSLDISFNLV